MNEKRRIPGYRKFKTYKELPGWRMFRSVNHKLGKTAYDIFKKQNLSKEELFINYGDTEDKYFYVGTLDEHGILKSVYLGDKQFFGRNLKQAVRFLFLKTQKPLQQWQQKKKIHATKQSG